MSKDRLDATIRNKNDPNERFIDVANLAIGDRVCRLCHFTIKILLYYITIFGSRIVEYL